MVTDLDEPNLKGSAATFLFSRPPGIHRRRTSHTMANIFPGKPGQKKLPTTAIKDTMTPLLSAPVPLPIKRHHVGACEYRVHFSPTLRAKRRGLAELSPPLGWSASLRPVLAQGGCK